MAGGADHAVGSTADQVAEGGEKLEEDGRGMGFGVGSDGSDGDAGETMEGGLSQFWMRGRLGWRERRLGSPHRVWRGWWMGIGGRRLGVLVRLRLPCEKQLGAALLYLGEGG
jgi:hypothetical protein